jgi:hypothetical protein
MKKFLFTAMLISLMAAAFGARAQYVPSMPGSLGVGQVTDTSVEWTFSSNGSMYDEIQLFVGDSNTPKMTQRISGYANSIVETGLTPSSLYEGRRLKAVYFGVAGPISATFPATYTLQRVPTLKIEQDFPVNIIFNSNAANLGEGMSAWQIYNETAHDLRDWIRTENLELGPFKSGETYVFRTRGRNTEGKTTDWSSPVSFTMAGVSFAAPAVPSTPPTPAKTQAIVAGSVVSVKANVKSLNVRLVGSLKARRIGGIMPGTQYEALEVKNGWAKINYNGSQGWVFAQYLKMQ